MKKSLAVAAIVSASLLLLIFSVYSARGLFLPEFTSARFFGLPTVDADGILYYRVYLSRNLAIVIAATVFLFRRQWQPLAVLTTAATALPVFDASVLYGALGGAAPLAGHVWLFVVASLASVLLWLRIRNERS